MNDLTFLMHLKGLGNFSLCSTLFPFYGGYLSVLGKNKISVLGDAISILGVKGKPW